MACEGFSSFRRALIALALGALPCGACGATPGEPNDAHPPNGSAGVALFDTPLWGVVELDFVWQDGRMVHGGDVVLEPELLIGDAEPGVAQQALVKRAWHTPWAMVNGVVTIPFEWDGVPDTKKTKILKAMEDWEAEMPFIQFVNDQTPSGRWVRIVSKKQAYCYVIMSNKGETVLEAGDPCGWHTYVHELGHVLGLRHEQLRKDRTAHVTFYKSRTTSPSQFCWDDGTHCIGKDYLATAYDLQSIMHYPSCMLAKESNCGPNTPAKWVLQKKSGTGYIPWWENRSFGQVLSASDRCGVKTMFGMACNTPTPPPSCVPKTCAQIGKSCGGGWSDGCGGTLSCGSCASSESCNAGTCVSGPAFPVQAWMTGTLQNDVTGSTLCAEVSGGSQQAGATIVMSTCSTTATEQNWTLTRGAQIKNYDSKRCASPAGEHAGAALTQESCVSSPLQQWKLGNMEIVNGSTGECVDVPSADYSVGKQLVVWPCHGATNQRFTYDAQTRELRIQGYCVTGAGSSGGAVTLDKCDGNPAQEWNAAHGGFSSRANANLCLAVAGGAGAGAGSGLVVAACNDKVGQMWGLRGQIEHQNDTFCLSAGTSGSQLTIAACDTGAKSQRFTFWSNFGCTPTTCGELAASCGALPDDCGATLACGTCSASEECGPTNACQPHCSETDAAFCARLGVACGVTSGEDLCGNQRTAECGGCSATEFCSESVCVLPAKGSLFTRILEPRGTCAEVAGGSPDDGAAIVPWLCNGSDSQLWWLDAGARLRAGHSGKCASVAGASAVGALLEQAPCSSSAGQKWLFPAVELVNAGAGKCADHSGTTGSVTLETCDGSSAQRFEYRAETRELRAGTLCVEAGAASGTPVVLQPCNGSASQQWTPNAGGFIAEALPGQCLGVAGGDGAVDGVALETMACDGGKNQRWALRGEIREASGLLCVQTPGDEGEQLTLQACSGGTEQQWTLWSNDDMFSCTPTTCEAEGKNCGVIDDGCEGSVSCGGCWTGETCGGSGVANVCGGCTPQSCAAQGKDCGIVDDGCGNVLDCGGCSEPATCGGSGIANVCGAPLAEAAPSEVGGGCACASARSSDGRSDALVYAWILALGALRRRQRGGLRSPAAQ